MRLSELLNIHVTDIDSKRMVITIRQGKGYKDRTVMLSPNLLIVLKQYYKSCVVKPKTYLFFGNTIDKPIGARRVQSFIKSKAEESGINKAVTPHILRHSFATHLLNENVDLRRIQILMGHKSLRTTSTYLHVSDNFINEIKSPIDSIMKENTDDK